ncbi:response regulator transcription factor [Cryptosporangium aurantiacum]|nr:response regulator [Cryptosporangium aurantiacum]
MKAFAPATTLAEPRVPTTGAQVLVIDDDPDIRAMLEWALSRSGLDVATAVDGRTGLAAASALRPDLIVLDVMMPGQSGLLVCDQLRRTSSTMTTPILMLSAAPTETNMAWGREAGANAFLAKPLSPALLTAHVHRMLDEGPATPPPWHAPRSR